MKVITTREIVRHSKTFFDLAENERIAVKRGKKFVNLIVTDSPDQVFVSADWVKEFMAIPEEYRCNPFDVSPSGDLFFADKRNLEKIDKAKEGKIFKMGIDDQKALFEMEPPQALKHGEQK
ncbi:MAG: hypothetical protein ACRDCN_05150 [Tannerellaceae bacterium]